MEALTAATPLAAHPFPKTVHDGLMEALTVSTPLAAHPFPKKVDDGLV